MKTLDIKTIRKDFPILDSEINGKKLVYLDSAATSQKPVKVIDRMAYFMTHENGTVRRGVYDLSVKSTQAFDETRKLVRSFINASREEEIIFTRGTTEAINLVAHSLCRHLAAKGEFEILISEIEHHANIVPWQINAEIFGAKIKVIPVLDNGELDLGQYQNLITSGKTKILAIGHVSNSLGTINPIKEMIKIAKQHHVITVVDGAQGVCHESVDVQDLDCDFYAFSGHKLYGPTGIGVLYGRYQLLEELPPYHGGGEMIETVSFEKTTYSKPPFKFEAGTPPIVEAIGLGEAIQYINKIGLSNIKKHEDYLLNYATNKLKQVEGLRIIGEAQNKASIISFVFDDIEAFDIGTMMNQYGIAIRTGHHCAQPVMKRFGLSSTARISFAMYNTEDDVDRAVDALQKLVKIFR
jgi:cysteine desulfurase / selenocysteine lyase